MMHLLLIEDETPAYQKLSSLLEEAFSGPFTHDWAKTNKQAATLLHSRRTYDLIFADIQLGDGLSLDVISREELPCPIIFCSAYNDYLLEAFRTNGIAYILKPYTREDLREAVEKYEKLFPPSPQLFKHLRAAIQRERKYKDRLVIKDRGKIHLQPVNQISLIEAKGDVCRIVRIDGKSLIYSVSLGGLLEQLDPDFFFRINRSQAVRIDHLASIEPYFKNRLTLRVHGHSETITTSSATTADFRNWLEG